jgi:hypothetical protein
MRDGTCRIPVPIREGSGEGFVEPGGDALTGLRADLPHGAARDRREFGTDIGLGEAEEIGLLELITEKEAEMRIFG